jgi:hypothetical protein
MPAKPKPKPDDPAQSKRFIETAKAVEASEDPEVFDKLFKRVTGKAPKPTRS